MKKFIAVLSLCSTSMLGAAYEPETLKTVSFSVQAPGFYNKTDSVLARSEPIKLYTDIKTGNEVSPEAAAQAFRELRAIRAIRNELGTQNPKAKLLERNTSSFFGIFSGSDYSEEELAAIEKELLKAAGKTSIEDELKSVREEVIGKNKALDDESNQNLSKLVFIEKFLKDPKKSREIVKVAQEIAIDTKKLPLSITEFDYPWIFLPDATRNSPKEFFEYLSKIGGDNSGFFVLASNIMAGFLEFAKEQGLIVQEDAFPVFNEISEDEKIKINSLFSQTFKRENPALLLTLDAAFQAILKRAAESTGDLKSLTNTFIEKFFSILPSIISKTQKTPFEKAFLENFFSLALREKDPSAYGATLLKAWKDYEAPTGLPILTRIENGAAFIALIENRDALSADTIKKIVENADQYDPSKSIDDQIPAIKELADTLTIKKAQPIGAVKPEKKEKLPAEEPQKALLFSTANKEFYTTLLGKIPTLFYGQIKKNPVSPQEASNLFKKIRASQEIRSKLEILEEGFEGTISAILHELKKIAGEIPDTLAPLRAEIIEKIKSDNQKLNQLVELEALWGTAEDNTKNREKILDLAQAVGIADRIKALLPEAALVEPEKKEESTPEEAKTPGEPVKPEPTPIEEQQAAVKYDFFSTNFYKNDPGGILYDSEMFKQVLDYMTDNTKKIDPAFFREFRALREVKKAISGKRDTALEGDFTEIALDRISGNLAKATNQINARDTFAPLRAKIIEQIKSDNQKLNQLVELETLWGTDEENEKNKNKIDSLKKAIGMAEIEKTESKEEESDSESDSEEESDSESDSEEESEIEPDEEEKTKDEPAKIETITEEKPSEEPVGPEEKLKKLKTNLPKKIAKHPPSKSTSLQIPKRFESIASTLKELIKKSAADALMLKNIDELWESTDPNNQKIVIQAAQRLGIWDIIKNIQGAPKEAALPQEKPKASTPPTKKALAAELAQAALAAKKTMGGQGPQPTPVVNLASSLEKLTTALQKLTAAIAPTA